MIEAANGIHRIVCEHMAVAAKIHAVENGRDIRRYTLLAFGGAGPIHAREVARRSGCAEILVPDNAGVFSAFGLLVAPMKMDLVRTRFTRLATIDWAGIEALFGDMEQALTRELASAGVPAARVEFRRSADMRFVGQGFEVETELARRLQDGMLEEVERRFHEAYRARFGNILTGQRIEIVNWRVEASVASTSADTAGATRAATPGRVAARRERQAFFPDINAFVATPVIGIGDLPPGEAAHGPALIEQAGSTIVVGPGDTYMLDAFGNVRISVGARGSQSA